MIWEKLEKNIGQPPKRTKNNREKNKRINQRDMDRKNINPISSIFK